MAPSIYTCTLLDTLPNPDERPNLTTPTLSMANNARSAPSPSPSTSLEPCAHAAAVSVERLVLDICHRERRGTAMQILTKKLSRSCSWFDRCVGLKGPASCLVAEARIPLYLYPFLNTSSVEKPIELLRLTSLGVIGALVKFDDAVAINYLIQTEMLPLCLRAMEMGTQLSKTVATLIVQKVLMDEVGLQHVCSTAERLNSVCDVLAFMVTSRTEPPNMRLLKYIILCYRRLSENLRASICLIDCLPNELRDGKFMECLRDDREAMRCLCQLLNNIGAAAFHAHQQGVDYIIRNWQ